jgi:hypothetical protein
MLGLQERALLTFEDAKLIALRHIGPECALAEESIIERPYGWYFSFQSKAYLETGDINKFLVGSGGFLVERDGGKIVRFGSAYPPERWLADYERGFRFETYDLTIRSTRDLESTLELLAKLRMTYVVPEIEHGTVWRIPKNFTVKQLRERLSSLPATFNEQSFWNVTGVFTQIDACGCCKYELAEHRRVQAQP